MKLIVSKKNTISIYRFMEMCGLKCTYKHNIKVSHSIMQRKLELRYELFPDEIILPKKVDYSLIKKDDILRGRYLPVMDDCKKILIYENPEYKILFDQQLSGDDYHTLLELEELKQKTKLKKKGRLR